VRYARPCLLAFAVGFALTSVAGAQDRGPNLDSILARAMDGRQVPAMAVVVIRHGDIAAEIERGVIAGRNSRRVGPGDVWHIGSDTKAMTATLIARLVERGVLDWNKPLAQLSPKLVAGMQPGYRNITLVDMFAHRAGFKDLIDSDFYNAFYSDTRPLHEQRLAYLRMALAQPPAYTPGTQNLYSNRGPLLAAFVAEDQTGLAWEQLIRRDIFVPLAMRSAAFGPTNDGENLGHSKGASAIGTKADDPSVLAPSGGVHLTMADWARFAIDQMKGERGAGVLLKRETYRFLHTGQGGTIYGLGWGVRSELDDLHGRFLTHAGSNGYWFARIVLVPDSENGILIAANAGPDDGADKASDEIEKAMLPGLK
jgi:CubicO group peptidase (beta-lactamase class C family)